MEVQYFIHPYAYLIGDAIFALGWLAIFLLRRDLRRELIVMSVVGAVFAPFAFIYLPDYWYPDHVLGHPLGIEDFIFAFSIAGIGGTLYETLARKSHTICECRKRNILGLAAIIFFAVATLIGLTVIFGLNSIYSSYIAFLVIFSYIMYFRRDLFWQSIASGATVGALMFLFYLVWIYIYPDIIQHWWKLENISGILVFGAPLEEIVWGFSWGIVGGVLYEFGRGLGLRS